MDAQKPADVNRPGTDFRLDNDALAAGRLRETLRKAGLRVTRQRLLVYRVLREMGGHRSVDDIVARLAEHGTPLPRMTVYNVVGDLCSVGAVMRADAGPGSARYEVSDTRHHHFVCRRCGTIFDVPVSDGAQPCLDGDMPPGAMVDEAQVIFRGVCRECGEKEKG